LLLIVSFLGELIGTVTVALSYYKGHRIATKLSDVLVPEGRNQATIAELDASAGGVRNVVKELKATWPPSPGASSNRSCEPQATASGKQH
jgi:hypothetical protein